MNIKQIWHFIWEEDSLASWIVNIILAFILIKFIFYPIVGLILGTSYPIVAVVSGSMEHSLESENIMFNGEIIDGYYICDKTYDSTFRVNFDKYWQECGSWYEKRNISKETFDDFRMSNGFNKGDIIILQSKKNVKQGDIIVFWKNMAYPIIHRVIEVDNSSYLTKGDHNSDADGFVSDDKVIGKALFKIPYLGWVKIWFVQLISLFV